jgi:hypothetical protein
MIHKTHVNSVRRYPGAWMAHHLAVCSCGWQSRKYRTHEAAQGAANVHVLESEESE